MTHSSKFTLQGTTALGQKFLGVLKLALAARRSRALTRLRRVVKASFDTPEETPQN
jgi:hypothetical protein